MRREKYVYNNHSLRYERAEVSLKSKIFKVIGFACAAVVTAFLITLISHRYFPSPKEKALLREIETLKSELEHILADVDLLSQELDLLHERDAHAHRLIFGMDPIDDGVWEGGVGGHDQYEKYRQFKNAGAMLIDVNQRIDKLKRQMVTQSYSLDTITTLAKGKEKMLAAIPSIKPVRSDKLKTNVQQLSGFGYRIHPVYKIPKMHYGIDFSAPSGTPIQSTGTGKVIRATNTHDGYGNCVEIDHGFGYVTLYGHMSRIDVKVGQEVVRGQQIGLVGSTGTSTAPHCHYEIIIKGEKVNPITYVLDNLTPQEYQDLVRSADSYNQSFDYH